MRLESSATSSTSRQTRTATAEVDQAYHASGELHQQSYVEAVNVAKFVARDLHSCSRDDRVALASIATAL